MDISIDKCLGEGAGEGAIVRLSGALDCDSAPRLQRVFDELLERSVNRVVVDLAGLAFCDSIGLSAFLVAQRSCADSGGFLRLAAPTPFVLRTLTVVGLLRPLPVYETLADACTGQGDPLSAPAEIWIDR